MFARATLALLALLALLPGCSGDDGESGAGGAGAGDATTSVTSGGGATSVTTSTSDTSTSSSSGGNCADPTVCGSCNGVVSFAADVEPFLAQACGATSCHKGVNGQAGLTLTVGKAYDELVNVPAMQCNDGRMRVLPGDPANSYILDKVLNVDVCSGKKMPTSSNLSDPQVQLIADWICGGALND